MSELNVADDAAFIEFAVRVGRDRAVRDALHAAPRPIAATQSDLFDMKGFAADFLALLQTMAERHRSGQATRAYRLRPTRRASLDRMKASAEFSPAEPLRADRLRLAHRGERQFG